MPYKFNEICIQFFDINITTATLGSQQVPVGKTRYRFLVKPSKYEDLQISEEKLLTDNFLIQAFSDAKLNEGETWIRYLQTESDDYPDYWTKQVPFYVRLRKHELSLADEIPPGSEIIKLDSYLLLNSLGCSVRVELRIRGETDAIALQKRIQSLCDENNTPFKFNDRPTSLKGLFSFYHDALIADGYAPAQTRVRPQYSYQTVVSVPGIIGKVTPILLLKQLDLNDLFAILFPTHTAIKFPEEDGVVVPRVAGLTITVFGEKRSNISITDFNKGTFIFMQDPLSAPNREVQVFCYVRNIVDYIYLYEMWFNYKRQISTVNPNALMRALTLQGVASIKGFENVIRNEVILRLLATHQKI